MKLTRLFFATDVHGSEKCWIKFINAGGFYKADAIILGGDLTGKAIVPIVEQSANNWKSTFQGIEHILDANQKLEEFEALVAKMGYYPYRCNMRAVDEICNNQSKIDELFDKLMKETILRWLKIADERLKGANIKCIVCPGNDDNPEIDKLFEQSSTVINASDKVIQIDENHEMLNVGWTNPTPWKTFRECNEEEMARRIDQQVACLKDVKNSIFELHAPPYGSGLDEAPELDETLKPTYGVTKFVGSTAVRDAIEKYQPLVGLHGHIHEGRGLQKIGRTLCFNPGSSYEQGSLYGVIINLDKDKVKSYVSVVG